MTWHRQITLSATITLATLAGFTAYSLAEPLPMPTASVHAPPTVEKKIDIDQAVPVQIPKLSSPLRATRIEMPDNTEGWAIKIPGGQSIPTPAIADGMVFVGGGWGSQDFYAFDAETGKLAWTFRTNDTGPTAAIVENGLCVFNTFSCSVYVLDAKTGKLVWSRYLAPSLPSQPTISDGRLYMAYLGGNSQQLKRGDNSDSDRTITAANKTQDASTTHEQGNRLLCADLRTGDSIWNKQISADVISAPILADNKVYLACQNGTSACLDATTGGALWEKHDQSTSAPVIADGRVFVTEKEMKADRTFEKIALVDTKKTGYSQTTTLAALPAPYLDRAISSGASYTKPSLRAVVGGAQIVDTRLPGYTAGTFGLPVLQNAVSVQNPWYYQGSRAAIKDGFVFNAQGNRIDAVSADSAKKGWVAEVQGKSINPQAQNFSPPAMGKSNMYFASSQGYIIALGQKDGDVRMMYATQQPMQFQPALANGNIYVGTANGTLLCLKTKNRDADGWSCWGGNAQHNKHD